MIKVKNWLIVFLIILFTWVLMNNSIQLTSIVSGVIIAILVSLLLCSKCNVFTDLKLTPKSFIYTFLYLGVFLIELLKSNIDVIRF